MSSVEGTPLSQYRTVRRTRVLGVAALAGALVGGGLAVLVLAMSPAQAGLITIPVTCSNDKVVLDQDDTDYELDGNCGVVEITASRTHVTMPTAQRLIVRGTGNVVVAKPIDVVIVKGHGNKVALPSARVLRLTSPGSVLAAEGLVEDVYLGRKRGTVTADQISELRAAGRGHDVRARRGFDAVVPGNRSDVRFRRLDEVNLRGDHNAVTVKRGKTEVRNSGSGNRVRVHRRG